MGQITKHRWVCDGCDDESSHTGGGQPLAWGHAQLTARGMEKQFWLCGMCFSVLLQNRRKGPNWFERLMRCVLKQRT